MTSKVFNELQTDKFKMNRFDIVNKAGLLEKTMNTSKFPAMLAMKMKNKNVVVEAILKMSVGSLDNLESFSCLVSEELASTDIVRSPRRPPFDCCRRT